ncbi:MULTISPECIES: disulfide bond formation protein B [Halobacteriales]|jgi:disulfide bond formation protein DsbB|uniref:disulfide bond formation protein B n=1 Tax=Halobacteriales TaxID=2235 RepID=UPI000678648A|nr:MULTISPECIES: disulfide bond formation protein B [Halobacteria]MDT3436880.1 disulfide bond formation protein B [Haloarcula sp. 1CSR25-25]
MLPDRVELTTTDGRFWLASGTVVATVATTGSLWFSLGLGLVPCTLCWYQRILMYPLVIVLGVAAVENHDTIWRTVTPLSVVGGVIAAYHSVLQATTTSCTFAGPCAVVQWRLPVLGLTIPNLSLIAFVLVTITVLAGSDVIEPERQL